MLWTGSRLPMTEAFRLQWREFSPVMRGQLALGSHPCGLPGGTSDLRPVCSLKHSNFLPRTAAAGARLGDPGPAGSPFLIPAPTRLLSAPFAPQGC